MSLPKRKPTLKDKLGYKEEIGGIPKVKKTKKTKKISKSKVGKPKKKK